MSFWHHFGDEHGRSRPVIIVSATMVNRRTNYVTVACGTRSPHPLTVPFRKGTFPDARAGLNAAGYFKPFDLVTLPKQTMDDPVDPRRALRGLDPNDCSGAPDGNELMRNMSDKLRIVLRGGTRSVIGASSSKRTRKQQAFADVTRGEVVEIRRRGSPRPWYGVVVSDDEFHQYHPFETVLVAPLTVPVDDDEIAIDVELPGVGLATRAIRADRIWSIHGEDHSTSTVWNQLVRLNQHTGDRLWDLDDELDFYLGL